MLMIPAKVSRHVRFLLMEFKDSDYDSLAQEICEFFDYGFETSICVLKTCLHCFTFRKSHANTLQLENVISLVLKRVLEKPNFATLISHALKDVEVNEEFVNDITIALHLSTTERISFGLALTYSEKSDASTSGRSFCMAEIERLCDTPLQIESAGKIHNIVRFLRLSEDLSEHFDSFIQIFSSSQSSDELQFVLKPILPVGVHEADVIRSMDCLKKSLKNNVDAILTEIEKETDVGDLIEELGYGFTADASLCKEILSLFSPLTEATISRILVVVVRTYAGLKDNYNTFSTFSSSLGCSTPTELPTLRSWNVDILFETIKQLAPGTRWTKVIENLDYEGFDIPNMEAFLFFMMVVRNICKEPFPLHAICSFVWKNMEGQLSFLKQAVLAPPEIFTFVHSSRKLVYTDNMHIHEELGLSNHAWLSLDLLDVLCQLAERGHAVSVRSLLQYPLAHFPRTLLLGMAHIKTAYNTIQREVVSDILPQIIENTQDSGFVLNLWQLNRELVIWGLLDAQNLGLDSMFRIIEICHELKILSSVIESVPLSFGIRLAILASQRGFLEIEKWLSNCLFLYKDVLFEECLKVIKDIHYGESKDISSNQFHSSDPISDLYLDATSLFLNDLKPYTNVITSPQLREEIKKVQAAILAPPSEVQDKISFIINNVSAANIESKGKEFAEILSIQYYRWFAQYMVMKRASVEQKFHDLYLNFLDKVNSQPLYKEIVQATYENCKVLLGSELIKSSSDERSLLKNLGSWLGKVTIGRNHVLRAREIDPKSLIVNAYEKGLLIAIIPFTSKVLEHCQGSIAYQPPNPWTMCILGLLSEIYSMPNLKMNLKFDIELLFKNLGVDIKDVKPTSLLKDRKREIDGNPDFRNKNFGDSQGSQPQIIDELKYEDIFPHNQVELPTNAGGHFICQLSAALPNIGNRVIINQKLRAFNMQFLFQRVVPLAIERAIREIVSGIFQRSVCIACQTTKELVLKDYDLEPDDAHIYETAHSMVASLAGSLAHVTCKEPLRTSIMAHLRISLQSLDISTDCFEQVVQLITNDNLDLGCAAIEQAAREKATQVIDADIAQQLLLRKKHIDGKLDSGVSSRAGIARSYMVSQPPDASVVNSFEFRYVSPLSIQNSEVGPAGDAEMKVRFVEPDPPGFQKQVSMLFAEWYQICELPGENEAACTRYVMHLHQSGLLKGDDKTESFFRILTEHSVAHCISSEEIDSCALQSSQQVQNPSFISIDIYAKLVFSILNNFREQESSCKSFFLSKIMTVTVRSIFKDAADKKTSLNPRPYFRLFINWLLDLCSLDPMTDGANCQVLIAFANAFHELQPLKIPAFSFAWLELVSHRSFMPKLLSLNGRKGWPYVQRLLMGLIQFLEPFLRNAELRGPVHVLYKGTLKVLLVLLHDYPEFLCDYHFTFCNVIPSSCIQMQNIILSSFPRSMRLPDPLTPNLKIDLLPEIVEAPCIPSEVDAALKEKQMKSGLDEYLSMRQHNSSFLNELKQRLLFTTSEAHSAGTRYNVPLLNSLVLYVGMQTIQQLQAGMSEDEAQWNENVPAVQMFKSLNRELDTEGRYLLLSAIANQLRYPNSHTRYFSSVMLYLFSESDQEFIKEQVTRVLLERLIVSRPHPWGLLVTFIELIKNPRYGFWKQEFIRCAPEIEKLFESVARSFGAMKLGVV